GARRGRLDNCNIVARNGDDSGSAGAGRVWCSCQCDDPVAASTCIDWREPTGAAGIRSPTATGLGCGLYRDASTAIANELVCRTQGICADTYGNLRRSSQPVIGHPKPICAWRIGRDDASRIDTKDAGGAAADVVRSRLAYVHKAIREMSLRADNGR